MDGGQQYRRQNTICCDQWCACYTDGKGRPRLYRQRHIGRLQGICRS
nr:MAG TPA: hypothetical protein [Caudoviricetes sp.]